MNFFKKNGDCLNKGDSIFQIFSNNFKNIQIAKKMIEGSYIIK